MLSLTPGKMTRRRSLQSGPLPRSKRRLSWQAHASWSCGTIQRSQGAGSHYRCQIKQNTCRCPEADLPVESGDAVTALVEASPARTTSWRRSSVASVAGFACRAPAPAARTYELKGQILAIDQARQELTIKHARHPGVHAGDDDAVQGPRRGSAQGAHARRADRARRWSSKARTPTCGRSLTTGVAALPDERPATHA